MALTYRLHGKILINFHRDLDVEFFRSNMEFVIHVAQPKIVNCHEMKSIRISRTLGLKMWPMGLTFAMILTLNFQGQIFYLVYILWQNYPIATKQKKWKYWLEHINFDLGHDFMLDFQGQFFEYLYLRNVGLIDVKRKGSISIGCWVNNATLTFDHMHGLDLG